jgi:hypothetical protein
LQKKKNPNNHTRSFRTEKNEDINVLVFINKSNTSDSNWQQSRGTSSTEKQCEEEDK